MKRSLRLRPLTSGDLPFADSLRSLAGWNQTMSDWERFLTLDANGSFLAELDHLPAGVVTTITYRTDLAWIGMLLVHPDFRRRGVGRALLERAISYLRQCGVECIKLDATPEGKPNYLKLGFQEEWTFTRWAGRPTLSPNIPGLRSWRPGDGERVRPLDETAFGTSRLELLESLARQSEAALVMEFDGYGMLRAGSQARYVGPVVARTHEAGLELVAALLNSCAGGKVFWDIPDQNDGLVRWARNQNLEPQRILTRMFLGTHRVPGDPSMLIALAAPELG